MSTSNESMRAPGALQGEVPRFLIVGVLNTLVGYGSYYLFLLWFGLQFQLALSLSWVLGTTHSYLWNRFWTFRSTGSHVEEGSKFLTVNIAVYLVTLLLNSVMVLKMGISPKISPLFVLVITTMMSFFGYKFWSFRGLPGD